MCVYVSHCVLFKGLSKLVHARIMNLWPAGEGGGEQVLWVQRRRHATCRTLLRTYIRTYMSIDAGNQGTLST